MNISRNFLQDFIDIPKAIKVEELALRLTMHTVEIDGVENQADKFRNVIVGRILEIRKHPNADRLQIARVHSGKEELSIVCGAPNIKVSQMVPLALPGAVLPNGIEIKKTEVRGEESCGMLCAPDELGLGSDHSGIMILEDRAKVGQPFGEYLGMDDVIFEVDNKSITNRPDLWSHLGIAREIAAFLDLKMKKDLQDFSLEQFEFGADKLKIKVENHELCPRYMALKIEGITIKDSPKWLRDRLIAVGVRPINNIVDVTNYVMLELGQPMHAFDAQLIEKQIIVREAKQDEFITTLDGKKRKLDKGMLLIADKEKPLGIAGIMGGENSEVSANTTSIILESANFEYTQIRKTSGKLGLRTDASIRYEKALDPNLCAPALARAVLLILESNSGAKISSAPADEAKFSLNQGPIQLDLAWLNSYIGQKIKKEQVIETLEKLGFEITDQDTVLDVGVPTWRATKDISMREDLSEEIMRIFGYDNISPQMPNIEIKKHPFDKEKALINNIKKTLSGEAVMTELCCYSFVGEDQLGKLGIDFSKHLRLANPVAKNQTLLRQSLAPNIIEALKVNQAREKEQRFFEIGSIFLDLPSSIIKNDEGETLPYQEKKIGFAFVSDNGRQAFFELKGILELLFEKLKLSASFAATEVSAPYASPNISAEIRAANRIIGSICVLDKKAAKNSGIKQEVALAELSLGEILEIWCDDEWRYCPYGKYPVLVRDLAFVVSRKNSYADVRSGILNYSPFIKEVELFDVYEGENIEKDKKNMAFHVVYQADRTLTQVEVDELQAGLLERMEEKFDARIRDF